MAALGATSADPLWRGRSARGGRDGDDSRGTGRQSTFTKALGDNTLKVQGDALWPTHLRKVCNNYRTGKDCRYGKECKMACYLTLTQSKWKKP